MGAAFGFYFHNVTELIQFGIKGTSASEISSPHCRVARQVRTTI
jgi:hypothetical protein